MIYRCTNKPSLTEQQSVYYEESLGGVPGGEECLQLREGEKRVAIRIVVPFMEQQHVKERGRTRSRGRVQS